MTEAFPINARCVVSSLKQSSAQLNPGKITAPDPTSSPAPEKNGYHGAGQPTDYFEWWYLKVADPACNRHFFFAYYVVNPGDVAGAHPNSGAYVKAGMYYRDTRVRTWDRRRPNEFTARYDRCHVVIGPSTGQDHGQPNVAQTLDAAGNELRIRGAIRPGAEASGWLNGQTVDDRFAGDFRWDLTLRRRAGWDKPLALRGGHGHVFNWLVYMMDADVSGEIGFNDYVYKADGWRGYQDHNWGSHFPEHWLWGHAFFDGNSSLVLGGGRFLAGGSRSQERQDEPADEPRTLAAAAVPASGTEPSEAAMLALYHQGRLYEFRPTTGDRLTYKFKDHFTYKDFDGQWQAPSRFEVTAEDRQGLARVEAQLLSAEQITLRLPLVTPEGAPFNDFQANGAQVKARLLLPAGQPGRYETVHKFYSELGGSEYGCKD